MTYASMSPLHARIAVFISDRGEGGQVGEMSMKYLISMSDSLVALALR